jgi:hypothetical protein
MKVNSRKHSGRLKTIKMDIYPNLLKMFGQVSDRIRATPRPIEGNLKVIDSREKLVKITVNFC